MFIWTSIHINPTIVKVHINLGGLVGYVGMPVDLLFDMDVSKSDIM